MALKKSRLFARFEAKLYLQKMRKYGNSCNEVQAQSKIPVAQFFLLSMLRLPKFSFGYLVTAAYKFSLGSSDSRCLDVPCF